MVDTTKDVKWGLNKEVEAIKAFQTNCDSAWFPDQIDLHENGVVTEPLN